MNLIKLIIPPIFFKVKSFLSRIYIKKIDALPIRNIKSNRMLIIGNGPSLNKSILLYREIIMKNECMAVNYLASTELFEVIRPVVYVLMDPAWFAHECNINQSIKECLNNIKTRTRWPMTIVVPSSVRGNTIIEELSGNTNIRVEYLYCGECPYSKMDYFEALDKNFIAPPSQTVLNTCVWLSIYWGYKETYLIGADTSFLADELVDQETNEVYTIDTHFYDNKEIYNGDNLFDKRNRRVIPAKFHEELYSVATALKGYWEMKEYADWKGVCVYNASEFSWIDAFERRKLDSIC